MKTSHSTMPLRDLASRLGWTFHLGGNADWIDETAVSPDGTLAISDFEENGSFQLAEVDPETGGCFVIGNVLQSADIREIQSDLASYRNPSTIKICH